MIRYGQHKLSPDAIKRAAKVMQHEDLSGGAVVEEFEAKLREATGAKYVVSCNSGTSALYMASIAVGIVPGRTRAIVPAISFVATANGPAVAGAKVEFTDVHPTTGFMVLRGQFGPTDFDDAIFFPVLLGGHTASLSDLRIPYSKMVIDACHAFPYYEPRAAACVYSFHPVKHVTTGEGGAVATDDESTYRMLLAARDNGRVNGTCVFPSLNFRLSAINAAIGIAEVEDGPRRMGHRRALAARYHKNLEGSGLLCGRRKFGLHNWHYMTIQAEWGKGGRPTREYVREVLEQRGIQTQIHYVPITNSIAWNQITPPGAMIFASTTLTLPLHQNLALNDVDYICAEVLAVAGG